MTSVARAQVTLAVIGIVVGVLGLARASGSFTEHAGRDIGYGALELHLMSYNRLGALITLVLAVLALLGPLSGRPVLVVVAAIGFVAYAVQVVLGFRTLAGGNVTGSNGATLSFCLMMAIGLGALAWAEQAASPQPTTTETEA
ncbi:MAG TPA: hypothetical protein VKD67_01470 [Acidimicrobiales bacterium]|nr:hypothetical protein [Acidimicrobiales bacterium]